MEHFISDVLMGGVVGAGVALGIYDGYFRMALERVNWWSGGRRGLFNPAREDGGEPQSDPG
jgi:membrane-associated phospholipid phosphatase